MKKKGVKVFFLLVIVGICACMLNSCEKTDKTCTCIEYGARGTVKPSDYGVKTCADLNNIIKGLGQDDTYCW